MSQRILALLLFPEHHVLSATALSTTCSQFVPSFYSISPIPPRPKKKYGFIYQKQTWVVGPDCLRRPQTAERPCLDQVLREGSDEIPNPEPYSVSTGGELPGRTSSLPGSVAVDGLLSSEIMPPFHLQLILWNNSLLSTLSYSLQGTISKQDNFLFSSLAWKKSYKKMVFSAILIKAIILEFVLSIWEPFGCQGQFPNISPWIGVLVFPTYQIFSSQLDIFNTDVFLKLFGDN